MTLKISYRYLLRIPQKIRSSTAPKRLPCIVVDARGDARRTYRLQTIHGILDTWYPSDELNKFEGDFSILKDNQSVISLGKAVNLHYPRPATKRERCKCRGSCLTHISSINCDNTSDKVTYQC